jgi:hypothetical protein
MRNATHLAPVVMLLAALAVLLQLPLWSARPRGVQARVFVHCEFCEDEPRRFVDVRVDARSVGVSFEGWAATLLPRGTGEGVDVASLVSSLVVVRAAAVEVSAGEVSAVRLHVEDGLRHEDLVRVMDACIAADLPSIEVAPQ